MSNELSTATDNQLNFPIPARLSDSLFSRDLSPHYMKLAGQLASSEIVPKCYRNKPADLFLCWSMGYQIGIPPEQSMQCIAVINGKPAMWGDDMLALCMAHPDFVDIIETPIFKDGNVFGYTCTIKRRNMSDRVNKFDMNDAKRAGLLAKGGVWAQYPDRMLKLRARGFSLRDAFPDALKGIKPREEVEDYIDADYKVQERKGSRTEQLKIQLNVNKEPVNVDATYGFSVADEDKEIVETHNEVNMPSEVDESEKEKADLHLEIERLIPQAAFTEQRVAKALKFYEVKAIQELSKSAAEHFIAELMKSII